MCGITFIHSPDSKLEHDVVHKCVHNINHRGPDDRTYMSFQNRVFFGFNRLIINDDSKEAMQPFVDDGIYVMCNGEIFNWENIVEKYNLHMKTSCDCEVILRLFQHLIDKKIQPLKDDVLVAESEIEEAMKTLNFAQSARKGNFFDAKAAKDIKVSFFFLTVK